MGLIALILVVTVCDAATISWEAVSGYEPAIPLFRNSHAAAMAALVKYHGLKKQNESDRPLVATCWMYAQYCECNRPGKPIIWRVSYGLRKLFTARRYPNTPIKQRCRYSDRNSEKAGWDKYVASYRTTGPSS